MVPFFFRSGGLEALGQDALVVRIGADISTREQLFDRFAVELGLPDYFGGNWDAFDEALRDLHWVESRRVVISHEGIPRLPEDVLRTYVEILARAVEDWKRDADQHEIVVAFPADAELRIRGLLKSGVSGTEPAN